MLLLLLLLLLLKYTYMTLRSQSTQENQLLQSTDQSINQSNFIAKCQTHKECVMVQS